MPEATAIHVPRDNVNDESVRLVSWLVADRHPVQTGQPIAEIETSKATAEIIAPTEGLLSHARKAGEEIEVGGLLGYVRDVEGDAAPAAHSPSTDLASHNAAGAFAPGLHEEPPTIPASLAEIPAEVGAQGSGHVHPVTEHVELPPAANGASETQSPAAPAVKRGTRIGPKAMALIRQNGLDPELFADRGLVRADDVLTHLHGPQVGKTSSAYPSPSIGHQNPSTVPAPARENGADRIKKAIADGGVPVKTEPLPRSKRVEARYLWPGVHEALPSVITVACATRGLRAACRAHPVLDGQTTALIIFETARLLRKFPIFNACLADGAINYYQSVNVGIAIDADRGLKVPVIRDADQKSLEEISTEFRRLVVDYLEGELPIESFAGGTFTITDLSGEGVFAFHPLINHAQSAILGVGGEFFAPGSPEGLFNLILAFDHQLTEGRPAAKFLNELKKRLAGYEQALGGGASEESVVNDSTCGRCMASAEELAELGHHLLRSVGARGEALLVCSRCVLGHG